jgi:hypothetical protein
MAKRTRIRNFFNLSLAAPGVAARFANKALDMLTRHFGDQSVPNILVTDQSLDYKGICTLRPRCEAQVLGTREVELRQTIEGSGIAAHAVVSCRSRAHPPARPDRPP